jgi:polygalacturonase
MSSTLPRSRKARLARRSFLTALGLGAAPLLVAGAPWPLAYAAGGDPWSRAAAILRRVRPPTFPGREFNIARFGAKGDGKTDCTGAIRAAIEACHRAGGGHVVVPAGRFLTGAVHLLGNVDLHLTKNATLAFSTDPRDYLPVVPTRFEGNDLLNYSPLIYAYRQQNVAVTGDGVLDGQASDRHWWPWKGKPEFGWHEGEPDQSADSEKLRAQGEAGVPLRRRVYGPGHYLRPSFVEPYGCTNVLIEGVTIRNSPFWLVHPLFCRNVTIRGITSASLGPNNDGCDPESCDDVLIERCTFDTGDDCIALKSGRGRDGIVRHVPCQNVVIRDCHMKNGHGGFTIGSEESGGVNNVFAENLLMDSPELQIAVRIKTNSYRGGVVEQIHVRDVQVAGVSDSVVLVDYFYEEGAGGPYRPVVRDINVANLTSGRGPRALYLRGYPEDPIRSVRLEHCRFDNVEQPSVIQDMKLLVLKDVTINGAEVGVVNGRLVEL